MRNSVTNRVAKVKESQNSFLRELLTKTVFFRGAFFTHPCNIYYHHKYAYVLYGRFLELVSRGVGKKILENLFALLGVSGYAFCATREKKVSIGKK